MRGRNPIGFRPRFLWNGVGVPDFIIFDIVLNRMRLGKLGTSSRFLSAFAIFAEDRRRFGNLCVQARTIALTFHYLCRASRVRILFANGGPVGGDSRFGIERFGGGELVWDFSRKCGRLPARCDKWKNDALFYRIEIQRRSLLRLAAATRYAVSTTDDRRGNLYPAP